jgi:hypothetical protein
VAHVGIREFEEGIGQTGRFGWVVIGLGLLIGGAGVVFWILTAIGSYDDSPVGALAARNDWFALYFLFIIEGIGFTLFGIMCMVAGWDRHHHPDTVH